MFEIVVTTSALVAAAEAQKAEAAYRSMWQCSQFGCKGGGVVRWDVAGMLTVGHQDRCQIIAAVSEFSVVFIHVAAAEAQKAEAASSDAKVEAWCESMGCSQFGCKGGGDLKDNRQAAAPSEAPAAEAAASWKIMKASFEDGVKICEVAAAEAQKAEAAYRSMWQGICEFLPVQEHEFSVLILDQMAVKMEVEVQVQLVIAVDGEAAMGIPKAKVR
ncbi:hypothetical protein AK812_SmicGene6991 [Symbiodinium microadriaticum]|uniref:Uncharacterized protein n=1 Tax=Symbiodinium microadriaticum TaxID=2951 RepID=A0A1Q9EPY0_SYMMI|nr:hypothetical protein AK812_SmicGene6991 [Symbiodinium microadriaticum]